MNDDELQALIDRLSAGEPIDLAAIPLAVRDDPAFQQFEKIARVTAALERQFRNVVAEPEQPKQLGVWRLLRPIGRGGMGDVWLGERADGTVEKRVAIKRVQHDSERVRALLISERRILARLEHPNIARFIDAGVDTLGAPWMALEYVEGMVMTTWCDERQLSLSARIVLLQKICAAVHYAHQHLIVHRDLKPSNVMVDLHGEPKLLDFGIAKLLDNTDTEQTVGALTPAYAAPEQLRGEPVSTATDVYALGLLLHRLLAGTLPASRTSGNANSVLADLDQQRTPLASVCAKSATIALPYSSQLLKGDLDAIIARALRVAPGERYESAAALADDLQRHLTQRPVRARKLNWRYGVGRFVRRHRLGMALSALAVVALMSGLLLTLRARQQALQQQQQALALNDFLLEWIKSPDPYAGGSAVTGVEELVLRGVHKLDTSLRHEPVEKIRLYQTFAASLVRLDRYQDAFETYGKAMALLDQSRLPQTAELTIELQRERFDILVRQRQFARADQLAVSLNGLCLTQPLAASEACREYANFAANMELVRGHLDDAMRLASAAIRDSDQRNLRDYIQTYSVYVLAQVLRAKGQTLAAATKIIDYTNTDRQLVAVDHPGLITDIGEIAFTLDALGDSATAADLFHQKYQARRLSQGGHALGARLEWAIAMVHAGEIQEAATQLDDIIRIADETDAYADTFEYARLWRALIATAKQWPSLSLSATFAMERLHKRYDDSCSKLIDARLIWLAACRRQAVCVVDTTLLSALHMAQATMTVTQRRNWQILQPISDSVLLSNERNEWYFDWLTLQWRGQRNPAAARTIAELKALAQAILRARAEAGK
jgi:eukaryotic-like serine/threonine-protein kinase